MKRRYAADSARKYFLKYRLDTARLYRLALEEGSAGARHHAVGAASAAVVEFITQVDGTSKSILRDDGEADCLGFAEQTAA